MGLLDWLFAKKIDYQQVIKSERDYTNKLLQEQENEFVLLDCKHSAQRRFNEWKSCIGLFDPIKSYDLKVLTIYDEETCWYNEVGSFEKKREEIFKQLCEEEIAKTPDIPEITDLHPSFDNKEMFYKTMHLTIPQKVVIARRIQAEKIKHE